MPEAEKDTTEQETQAVTDSQAADPAKELEALKAKYERAQADLTKFRTRADEVEAAKREIEEKALQEKELAEQLKHWQTKAQELEQQTQAEREARTRAERIAALTGKVADPKAAIKLLEDKHLSDDGGVNVDALLADYGFLAPSKQTTDATRGGNSHQAGKQTPDDAQRSALQKGDVNSWAILEAQRQLNVKR